MAETQFDGVGEGGRGGGVCVRWGLSGGGGCFCVLVTGWMALETENWILFWSFLHSSLTAVEHLERATA